MSMTAPGSAPVRISEIAAQLGLDDSSVEPWGWYFGKLAPDLHTRLQHRQVGHYVGVTAINPTPFGEGKTVVAIGLSMGLSRLGHRAIVTLRQPSLAPVFGIKGGGAGGGAATLLPMDDINLHFTGDLHAVAAANNLLAAMLDNHARRGLLPAIAADAITWRRVIDMNDKGLAHIVSGLDEPPQAPRRETGFDLTAASEVMSVLALATDLSDLRRRIGRIAAARTTDGAWVTAEQVGAAGAMTALLRQALRPNLVQTCEQTPALVHAGPFANISHGNCSVIADLTALRLADYVVTESGFGADLGAEKLFDIKCRTPGLRPRAEVLVCTIRALKYQSGRFSVRPGRPLPPALLNEDHDALIAGSVNLGGHLNILRQFHVPAVVAINRFPEDSEAELKLAGQLARDAGAQSVVVVDAFRHGGQGAIELAEAVVQACSGTDQFAPLYPLEMPLADKLERVVTQVYGADGLDLLNGTRERLQEYEARGFGQLPVCIAKTQYSLSHDPARLGRPVDFRVPIRDVRLAAGAGFVLAQTEGISLMPGLPREPAARRMDIDACGHISGTGQK